MVLNHVALTVSDRERSAAFYGTHFGLTRRIHDDDHLLILTDRTGSLLALTEGVPAVDALPRSSHFGFLADRASEVHDARDRMRAAGVQEAEWQEAGPVRLQVLDPDGYRVGLLSGRAQILTTAV